MPMAAASGTAATMRATVAVALSWRLSDHVMLNEHRQLGAAADGGSMAAATVAVATMRAG